MESNSNKSNTQEDGSAKIDMPACKQKKCGTRGCYMSFRNLTYEVLVDTKEKKPKQSKAGKVTPIPTGTQTNDAPTISEQPISKASISDENHDFNEVEKSNDDNNNNHIVNNNNLNNANNQTNTAAIGHKNEKEKRGGKFKKLLSNVSGYVKPGCMLALMGGSGAGKSTLLDLLANRKTGGRIAGELLINGKPRDKFFTRLSGYVEQFDTLEPMQSVREAIEFSAMCRLSRHIPYEEKMAFVDQVMKRMDLLSLSNKLIGSGKSGLSQEQRKRVNIAIELAADPQLLFLDEPTTALDSGGAKKVITYVRDIATNSSKSVICTIHQPSPIIFEMFDFLLLLTQNGEVAYFGPIKDNSQTIFLDYCKNLGFNYKLGTNPADFALDFSSSDKKTKKANQTNQQNENQLTQPATPTNHEISENNNDNNTNEISESDHNNNQVNNNHNNNDDDENEVQTNPPNASNETPQGSNKTVVNIVEAYTKSGFYEQTFREIESTTFLPPNYNPPEYNDKYAAPLSIQLQMTILRTWNSIYRIKIYVRAQYIRSFLTMLLISTLFWRLGTDQAGARNRISLTYYNTFLAALNAISTLPLLFAARPVYYRDQAAGIYKPFSYLVSIVVSFSPLIIICSLLYVIPVYWISNLDPRNEAGRFFFYLLVWVVLNFTLMLLCQFLAIISPTLGIAKVVASVCFSMFGLFTGFLIPHYRIPGWWIWFYWVGFFRWPVESMSDNQMHNLPLHCKPGQGINIPLSNGGTKEYCQYTNGNQYLSFFGFKDGLKIADFLVLVGILCFLLLMMYVALKKVRYVRT